MRKRRIEREARIRDLVLIGLAAALGLIVVMTAARSGRGAEPPAGSRRQPELDGAGSRAPRRSLVPVSNPDPDAPRQPTRARPHRIAVTPDGAKAYITLPGKEIEPGSDVAVIDVPGRRRLGRIPVGSHPYGIALHPSGRWVVVTNRFSSFLSVIDVAADRVVAEVEVPFYCDDVVFSPDGSRAYVSNFWKDQVILVDLWTDADRLTGAMRALGFDRRAFLGRRPAREGGAQERVCELCGWRDRSSSRCPRCGHGRMTSVLEPTRAAGADGVYAALRARCGTAGCHLYRTGGFEAGSDEARAFESAATHAFPGDPANSPLLRIATGVSDGGWADGVDGRHHPGGVVFGDPARDADYRLVAEWIASGREGPGIAVGEQPRDLAVSADGETLYVANTGSLDVSVVDLGELREVRRIFTRSPVNDVAVVDGWLMLATLGVGSGHPKARHAGRESLDRAHPDAEFTLFRDLSTGRPRPLDEQDPLGPYDAVDGTRQEKFRDITNDLVVLDPAVPNVAAYAATGGFTRYTSDSFEALAGDLEGDVPAELMQVVGAFPEQIARHGDRVYVSMAGTFQVQEWRVDPAASPARRLVPGRVFDTGLKPGGLGVAGDTLVVANQLGDSVTFVSLADGATGSLDLADGAAPFPATDFERGELFVQTSVFSVDQDQSCVHCHYRDTSDGKQWSVSQVMGQSRDGQERTGGSREVPDLRALVQKVPFFVEGTLSLDEPLTMMMEHNPLVDFQGDTPAGSFEGIFASAEEAARPSSSADAIVVASGRAFDVPGLRLVDLLKRREVHVGRIARRYLGREYSFRELQRLIGAYQAGEPRLLPNPADPDDPMVRHGRALFESPAVGCAQCHPAPAFTDKVRVHNQNRAFPPLVTAAPRDNVHTLVSADRLDWIKGYVRPWDPDDRGRVEEHEGFFVAPSLRGLWARPARLLHHGHASGLREVVATPGHPALRPVPAGRLDPPRPDGREAGMNERDGVPDTHGATSHLSVWDLECLLRYLESIE